MREWNASSTPIPVIALVRKHLELKFSSSSATAASSITLSFTRSALLPAMKQGQGLIWLIWLSHFVRFWKDFSSQTSNTSRTPSNPLQKLFVMLSQRSWPAGSQIMIRTRQLSILSLMVT
ncbi:hypothetical protein FGO68_gene13486 [Halteria grandinella]|uniref:Uncharacterized protein n=1 Tax=Halteria grandinella TaxID=5974 RepID=A0A8J8NEN2_HALGN|nr:hypothetical protein FGO68_gene13486 [Halteria grandinella]